LPREVLWNKKTEDEAARELYWGSGDSGDLGGNARADEAGSPASTGIAAEFREAVVLCELEELSYEEAAQAAGCPIGTIRSRLLAGARYCWPSSRCCATCRGARAWRR